MPIGSIQEDLKQEYQNSILSAGQDEKEALMKVIGGIGQSSSGNRLTAKEKRVIAVQKSVEEMYLSISTLLSGIPFTRKDSVAIAMNTVTMSDSHAKCCRQSDAYLEFMEKLLSSSAFIGLGTSHLMLVVMILANHGVNVLSFIPGFQPPQPTQPENKPPEFSEEDRANLMIMMLNRQAMFQEQLDNAGDN